MLCLCFTVQAQQAYQARVQSTDGSAVEGVIVSVTGEKVTAVSDADGEFSLKTENENALVQLAAPGYYTRKISLRQAPSVIVMVPVEASLYNGEVVLDKSEQVRDEASAILNTVLNKDMKSSPSATLAWQDVDPALKVERKSGMPGEGAYFNIRGLHTFNAENTPLILVNGVPYLANTSVSDVNNAYSRDAMFAYNAADIRSITVLKGAEAAMYGALASNGVILVETEQATSDNLDTRITFSGNYGLSQVQRQMPGLGVSDFQDYLMETGQTRYASMSDFQKDYPFLAGEKDYYHAYLFNNHTDWTSQIYSPAMITDNVLRVEGGDEVAKYNISFGYTREEGVLDNTNTNRYHTALNTNIMVSPEFEIFTSVNLAYINSNLNNTGMMMETNPILAACHAMPNLHPFQKLPDGGIIDGRYSKYNGWTINPNPSHAYDVVSNPAALVNTVSSTDKIYDANIRLGLNYKATDLWTLTGLVNLYYDYTEEYVFTPGVDQEAIIPQLFGTGENFVSMGVLRQSAYYYNLNAAYHNFFSDKHGLDAYVGARLMTKSYEYDASSGYNSANDYNKTLSKVTDEWNILGNNDDWKYMSFYAHADYLYDNLWKATAGLSLDGTSVSGVDAPRFGLFPSLSATYMAANAGILPEAVNHLNITGELSLTGNSRFSSNYGKNYYVSNNLFNLGTIVRNGVPNTHLEWEKKAQADLGIDLSMWKHRFDFRLNGYFAHHYDLLLDTKISSVYGSNEAYYANTAAINNMGLELSARYDVVDNKAWNWIVYANASLLRSRIADLGELNSFIQTYGFYNGDDAQTRLQVGKSPYEFWGYETAGIYATTAAAQVPVEATGKPLQTPYGGYYQGGDVIFVDQNHDGVINDKDRVSLGSASPDVYGAFGTSLRYKALTLTADFAFSLGNEAYNATRRQVESMDNFYNQSAAVLNRWHVEGQQTDMPRAAYGDPSGNALFSERWIEDASYLKLRRLMLAYRFDQSLLKFVGGRVWIAAENLWTLTSYLGADPEFSYSYAEALRGFDYAKVSNPTVIKLGVNLNF